MHALPDDLGTLTPERLLAAYDRTPTGPLYAEILRRLRQIPAAEAEVRRLRAALQVIVENVTAVPLAVARAALDPPWSDHD
jgi:hypothetical protein